MRTLKTEHDITFIPPVNDGKSKPEEGWLNIDGKIWEITNWYSWDDFGHTLETLTIKRGERENEIYSQDEGASFTFDLGYEG